MVAPFMALAHGIGRIGCFLNGCCWGRLMKWELPWGVCYPKAIYGPYREQVLEGLIKAGTDRSLPIHPTQLYETLGNFIIFMILLVIYKRHKRTGIVVFLLHFSACASHRRFRGEHPLSSFYRIQPRYQFVQQGCSHSCFVN